MHRKKGRMIALATTALVFICEWAWEMLSWLIELIKWSSILKYWVEAIENQHLINPPICFFHMSSISWDGNGNKQSSPIEQSNRTVTDFLVVNKHVFHHLHPPYPHPLEACQRFHPRWSLNVVLHSSRNQDRSSNVTSPLLLILSIFSLSPATMVGFCWLISDRACAMPSTCNAMNMDQ